MSLNNETQENAETREQHKKQKKEAKISDESGRIRVRLIPIWLRIILVVILIVLSTVLGTVVGYSVIGDGKATEVFDKSTWTHIMDLIEKK